MCIKEKEMKKILMGISVAAMLAACAPNPAPLCDREAQEWNKFDTSEDQCDGPQLRQVAIISEGDSDTVISIVDRPPSDTPDSNPDDDGDTPDDRPDDGGDDGGPDDEPDEVKDKKDKKEKGNNGHGNDADRFDSSNPGNKSGRDDTDDDGLPPGHAKKG
jgi:hypothetical protein